LQFKIEELSVYAKEVNTNADFCFNLNRNPTNIKKCLNFLLCMVKKQTKEMNINVYKLSVGPIRIIDIYQNHANLEQSTKFGPRAP